MFQTADYDLAKRSRLRAMLHSLAPEPRARGTPGFSQPTAPCACETKHTGKSPRTNRKTPAFRARCLRLAPQDPRWAYRFRQPSFWDPAASPPLEGMTAAGAKACVPLRPPRPCDARLARRDRAAWASGVGATSRARNRPPHPAPRLVTIAIRPSGGTGYTEYSPSQGILSRIIFRATIAVGAGFKPAPTRNIRAAI